MKSEDQAFGEIISTIIAVIVLFVGVLVLASLEDVGAPVDWSAVRIIIALVLVGGIVPFFAWLIS